MAITSVTPDTAMIGEEITIEGSNLGAMSTSGRNTVHFNGVQAFPTSWAPDKIVVQIPDGATSGPLSIAHDGEAEEIMFVVIGGSAVATAKTSAAADNEDKQHLDKTDQMKMRQPGVAPNTDGSVSGIPTHNATGSGASQKTATDLANDQERAKAEQERVKIDQQNKADAAKADAKANAQANNYVQKPEQK